MILAAAALAGCGRAPNELQLLGSLPDVASIEIKGNQRFSDGTLKGLMTLKEGTWWNPFEEHKYRKGLLDTDIQAILTYYMRHGYLRAQLVDRSVRTDGDDVYITLTFSEGEPVTVTGVSVRGSDGLDPGDLRKDLALKSGHPLDPFALVDDQSRLLRSLADRGLWEGSVRSDVQFFGDSTLVFYRLQVGDTVRVRELKVEGIAAGDDWLVRREVSVKRGEPLKLGELQKSRTRLFQSGYFANAQWDTTGLDSAADRVTVVFRVRERKLHWVETGIGVNSQEQVRLTEEWGSRSFLGSGMRFAATNKTEFDFTGRNPSVLNSHRSDLLLNQPHLFGSRWEGQPSASYLFHREIIPDTDARYSQNVLGLAFSARRQFGDLRNQVVLSVENRWVYNRADSLARYSDPQLYRHYYQTRLFTARVDRDTRNDFFSPTAGSYESALLESAGGALGGNNAFRKGTLSISDFAGFPADSWVLAWRLQGGLIKPSSGSSTVAGRPVTSRVELIPSEDRYRLGGANTIRGFVQDELNGTTAPDQPAGGLVELLGNLELRIPLVWRISAVPFLDAGNVWQDRTFISWESLVPHRNRAEVSPFDVRYSYGAGLRFDTPLGPVRLDYAHKWNIPEGSKEGKERWHVALGQAF